MTIDEALKQLTFNKKKAATIIKEVGNPSDIATIVNLFLYVYCVLVIQSNTSNIFISFRNLIKLLQKCLNPRNCIMLNLSVCSIMYTVV